jgi:hypothetical protein
MRRGKWTVFVLILGGCVPSLHPLYLENDLVLEPTLLGTWKVGDETWTFSEENKTQYKLVCINAGRKIGEYNIHMLKLHDQLFLDLFPVDLNEEQDGFYLLHFVPSHSFLLVKQLQPDLKLAYFDPEWLREYLKSHPDAIRHEEVESGPNDGIILTASTQDLQTFVLQHVHEAFRDIDDMTPVKSNDVPIVPQTDHVE